MTLEIPSPLAINLCCRFKVDLPQFVYLTKSKEERFQGIYFGQLLINEFNTWSSVCSLCSTIKTRCGVLLTSRNDCAAKRHVKSGLTSVMSRIIQFLFRPRVGSISKLFFSYLTHHDKWSDVKST